MSAGDKMETGAVRHSKARDGGWGWIVVLGSFLAFFIADGWAYSFGIFFIELQEQFEEGKGRTAMIGALLYGLPLLISPIVCACTSVFGCRRVAIGSGIVMWISFSVSYFAQSFNIMLITTGILVSTGLAMAYIPSVVVITYYFEKHLAFATGLAVTGSGIGAFVFPIFLNYLFEKYAWRGTVLVLGAISLHLVVVGCLYRPFNTTDNTKEDTQQNKASQRTSISLENVPKCDSVNDQERTNTLLQGEHSMDIHCDSDKVSVIKSQGCWQEFKMLSLSMCDKSLATNWVFLVFCAGNFILYMWISMPFVYLVDMAVLQGISKNHAIYLLSIIGIARIIGQIALGLLVDHPRVNCNLVYSLSFVIAGLATGSVPCFHSYVALVVYCTVFGLCFSSLGSIQMKCVIDIVGLDKHVSAFGLLQLSQGITTTLGVPIAGWLYDQTNSYDTAFLVAGGFILFSSLIMLPVPIVLWRKSHTVT